MVKKFDWTKFEPMASRDNAYPFQYEPGELTPEFNLAMQPKWNIPEKVSIQATNSGGGSHFTKEHNPNHPMNSDEIRDSVEGCIKAGASAVHIDNRATSWVTKDGKAMSVVESYEYVIKPLLKKYGREKFMPHVNSYRGTYKEAMTPFINGLAELSYVPVHGSLTWIKTTVKLFRELGIRQELIINYTGHVDYAERYLIRTGILPNPNLWIYLPAIPLQWPNRLHDYMPNEKAMCQGLFYVVDRIKEVDPGAFITVCDAGRPTRYLTTLALMLGLHIRVGMEDTVWKYPHKNEKITSNGEEVRAAIEIARLLGREVMTPNELREAIGLKPRYDYLPKGMK